MDPVTCRVCKTQAPGFTKHSPTLCLSCHGVRTRASRIKRTRNNREKLVAHLMNNPCVDCGETDWVVLQFDHREPAEKLHSIANMISHNTWLEILWEMEKCDVRCANCHTRKTALEFGYYAYFGEGTARMH
jgi:hypothetical protein